METKENILHELREISPLMAQLAFNEPFTIPEHYFEQLDSDVKDEIGIDANLSPLLAALRQKSPFNLPVDYFNSLSEQGVKPLLEEEPDTTFLASITAKEVFVVPDNYFNSIENNVLELVKLESADAEVDTSYINQITVQEVFVIPQEYFNTLETNVLERIQLESGALQTDTTYIDHISVKEVLRVPNNYFNELPQYVIDTIKLENGTLQTDTSLINELIGNVQPFTTPSDYFANLSEEIMASIQEEEATSQLLEATPIQDGFGLPDDYFATLQQNVMARIKEEETLVSEEDYLLETVGTANPFQVPAGYFDQLSAQVLEKIAEPVGGKIIDLPHVPAPNGETKQLPSSNRRWLRRALSVAAVFAVCMIGLQFLFTPTETQANPYLSMSPAEIIEHVHQSDKKSLRDHVENNIDDYLPVVEEHSAVLLANAGELNMFKRLNIEVDSPVIDEVFPGELGNDSDIDAKLLEKGLDINVLNEIL